jgi:hypothetical protein
VIQTDVIQTEPDQWQPLSVRELAVALRGLASPWWIAGGWALDLFLGRQIRPHADIDVLILRPDQLTVQHHLSNWQLHKTGQSTPSKLAPWPPGEHLDWSSGVFSLWARRHDDDPWRFQLLLMETDGPDWIFRRDPRIRGPIDRLGWHTPGGLPILRPEIQLLYKAGPGRRPKDDADFVATAPALSADARSWLTEVLTLQFAREHPWIDSMSQPR